MRIHKIDQTKKLKEFGEILSDKNDTEKLLSMRDSYGIFKHITKMKIKYPIESLLFGINNINTQNYQQSGLNLLYFFAFLLAKKGTEIIMDSPNNTQKRLIAGTIFD